MTLNDKDFHINLPQAMQDIHDIELPVQVGWDHFITQLVVGVLILMAALGLFLLIHRYMKRKKGSGRNEWTLPPVPPDQAALEELGAIASLMEENPRLYYFRLTALLKTFVGSLFNINAPEMTTQEFVSGLNLISSMYGDVVDVKLIASLKSLFEGASMVKYAALFPDRDQMERDTVFAKNFIEALAASMQGEDK
ncbi:MAG: hypothetical protein HQK66_07405 [Desulfamplus sp.]|nr:hypothetical protein [Desulfamplus sp.]